MEVKWWREISWVKSDSWNYMGVSKNRGTPKSSILIGFSIINHPCWGFSPYFWKHPYICVFNHFHAYLGMSEVGWMYRLNWFQPIPTSSTSVAYPTKILLFTTTPPQNLHETWFVNGENCHHEFQVPKMEGFLNLAGYFRDGFSLT